MRQFGLLQAIWMSFYSSELYRDVGRNWKGSGLLYLTLLLALSWLPITVQWFAGLRAFATTEVPKIASQLPDITISNGVMQARPPGRHVITDADRRPGRSDEPVLIIDDSIDEVPTDIETETIVLTRREVGVIRPSRNERRVLKLTSRADMDLTRGEVAGFLSSLQFWIPPLGYVIGFLLSLAFRSAQACLYGWLAQVFAQKRNVTLDFRSALRLAAVAITPVIVIRTVLWSFPPMPAWYIRWPTAIVITLFYLRFAVGALAEEPTPFAAPPAPPTAV
jgi:hypothetical protein